MRSCHAHTSVFQKGNDQVELFKRGRIDKRPFLHTEGPTCFVGTTFRFSGCNLTRMIDIDEDAKLIRIKDTVTLDDRNPSKNFNFVSNFVLPEDREVTIADCRETASVSDVEVELSDVKVLLTLSPSKIGLVKGKGVDNWDTAVISRVQGQFSNNSRIRADWLNGEQSFSIRLNYDIT